MEFPLQQILRYNVYKNEPEVTFDLYIQTLASFGPLKMFLKYLVYKNRMDGT